MRYFLLQCDADYTDVPNLIDWADNLILRNLSPANLKELPERMTFKIQPNPHTLFSDIISTPFLLLSKMCMEVVKIYNPHIKYRDVILFDRKNKINQSYCLPILPQIECLAEGSRWNLDKSILINGVLDLSRVGDLNIFQLADLKNNYTVIRLDVLESMLKRGARGLEITPLDTVRKDD